MTTLLKNAVRRQTLRLTETHGRNKGRPIIVELVPGDELSFRVKGTRNVYSIYLGHCLRLAQIQTVETLYRKAMETYTAKKKAGYKRLRKPKRSSLPYSDIYFKALKT